MSFKVTPSTVARGFNEEITDWRERQIGALNQFTYPTVESQELFKVFAWANFGTTAVTTLFPKTVLGDSLTKSTAYFAIPLWIIGQVTEQIQRTFDQKIADSNTLLATRFEELRDTFTREVQSQARRFMATAYAERHVQRIHDFLKETEFTSEQYAEALCREIVHQANLVVTDPAKIREVTQKGFGALCQKLALIWKGSYHTPGGWGIKWGYSETGGVENARWKNVAKRGAEAQVDKYILARADEYEVKELPDGRIMVYRAPSTPSGLRANLPSYLGADIELNNAVPAAIHAIGSHGVVAYGPPLSKMKWGFMEGTASMAEARAKVGTN
jgi:hypothetical protein